MIQDFNENRVSVRNCVYHGLYVKTKPITKPFKLYGSFLWTRFTFLNIMCHYCGVCCFQCYLNQMLKSRRPSPYILRIEKYRILIELSTWFISWSHWEILHIENWAVFYTCLIVKLVAVGVTVSKVLVFLRLFVWCYRELGVLKLQQM